MLTQIRTNIAPVTEGLLLVIILYLPTDVVLYQGRKIGDVRKVAGVKEEFHFLM
jgi:hypothetical protein